MRRSSGSRKTANLSESLHQRLNMYTIAATAAGVGMLALAQASEAKIIYTPTHMKIGNDTVLDLNHDGITDFVLIASHGVARTTGSHGTAYNLSYNFADVYPNVGNGAVGTAKGSFRNAVALRPGSRIGPRRLFNGDQGLMAEHTIKRNLSLNTYKSYWTGQWANGGKGLKNRYLGVKFNIKGKFHYGWARVTVVTGPKGTFHAVLTGYAYETIPNTAIIAGKMKGPDDSDTERPDAALVTPNPGPATLGALAMGAPGLSIWRREESLAPTHERGQ